MTKNTASTPAKWWPRIISGAVILAVLVGCFFLRELSEYVFDLLIGTIMIICAYEVENLLHKMDRPTWSVCVGFFPVLSFMMIIIATNVGLNFYHFILINLGILVIMFLVMFALPLIFGKWGNKRKVEDGYSSSTVFYSVSKAMNTIFVCLWPTFFLSFAFILNHFGQMDFANGVTSYYSTSGVDFGLLALIMLFVTSMFADTFAMLTGRLLKGPKVNLEKLGPGKSWSGLIGGVVGATIASLIIFTIFDSIPVYNQMFSALNISVWVFLIGGIFSGVFNMCGDLFSSLFKRRAVVKDFSQIIPGHGGVMDRCNGLLANAIFVFIFFIILFV